MARSLIIVESPAKIKTLKKFLGAKFSFEASMGHIRDLPVKEFGIDVDGGFEPTYVNLPDKKDVIARLKKAAKDVDEVYLSPDPDREGEAIAWHISTILPKGTVFKRIAFHSITKGAVLEALAHPREIDMALVDAQQARRLLDRMVGYTISPILTRKLRRGKGTSAGRVQSVALKLVVDREKEIENFKSIEYWVIKSILENLGQNFEAVLFSVDGKKVEKEPIEGKDFYLISNEKAAALLVARLKKASYEISSVERKEKKRYPVPPFITSTLQQEASRHFGFNVSRTMNVAQSLYEGIDMQDDGVEGLITYMRTDSVQVAKDAIQAARGYIKREFGEDFLPEKEIFYASKKSAQEAHEAIRPTELDRPPEKVKKYLTDEQFKLYQLIWRRFVASQMKPAIYDTVSADVDADNMVLRVNGSHLKFSGFLAAYEEKWDSEEEKEDGEKLLPELKEGAALRLLEVNSNQSFTKPPPRFTEASLVKELEKSGIGRPSTYASIMNKIHSREYTIKKDNVLIPTELGRIIVQMLEENFKNIMDITFTARMEDQLELVAEKGKEWKEVLKEFWDDFSPMVEKAKVEARIPKEMTDIPCPECKKPLQKIWSKNRYFYGCSGYPECKYTKPFFNKEDYAENFDWNQLCPKCGEKMVLRQGRFGIFLGCGSYPKCKGILNIPRKGEEAIAPENMPDCPALGCDGKVVMRRSKRGKPFYSCSNFPECDIIVNSIDDLDAKYDEHHPKTPYKKVPYKKGEKGFKRSFKLSDALADVVGEKELSRGAVLKKIWAYIKENKLQDPKNGRIICPDEKLAKVLGKEPIDMMKLSTVLKGHLL